MSFQFMQKSMTLSGKNALAVTGNQKLICYGRNVRLMLVLLTYLLYMFHLVEEFY